jgi:Fe-Mn family superoxide dismutase
MSGKTATMPEVRLVEAAPLADKVFTTERVGISRKTHEAHFKLFQGYANKTNEIRRALAETEIDPSKANQVYSAVRALKADYSFAYGGFLNHELYFDTLGGEGDPSGALADQIAADFGSHDAWKTDLKAAGMAGRGWAWLAWDRNEGRLANFLGDAQNTYPMWNCVPLVGLDVYEHAYYLDFGTDRASHIDAFLQAIDWDAVSKRFNSAKG